MFQTKGFTLESALGAFPVLGASPHASCSSRYAHIPTIDVLKGIVGQGFEIRDVTVAPVRKEDRKGFQKHLVRLRRPEHAEKAEAPELILLNAHDRTSPYKLLTGCYRFACANGIITGEEWGSISVRHSGRNIVGDVIDATYTVVEQFDKLAGAVDEMKAIELSKDEQHAFARTAVALRFGEGDKLPVSPERFNSARRREDVGNDLWRTFNRVQENLTRGGLRGFIRNDDGSSRRSTVRAVKSIDGDVKLNRALFTLAEGVVTDKSLIGLA